LEPDQPHFNLWDLKHLDMQWVMLLANAVGPG